MDEFKAQSIGLDTSLVDNMQPNGPSDGRIFVVLMGFLCMVVAYVLTALAW